MTTIRDALEAARRDGYDLLETDGSGYPCEIWTVDEYIHEQDDIATTNGEYTSALNRPAYITASDYPNDHGPIIRDDSEHGTLIITLLDSDRHQPRQTA